MTAGHESAGWRQAGRSGKAAIMGGKQLLGLALLAAMPGHSEAASPKTSSSSATVQIHLSVAPRMRLVAMDEIHGPATAAPGGGYCLMSNVSRTALPIYLTWPDFEPTRSSLANQDRHVAPPNRHELSGCRGKMETSGDAPGTGKFGAGLALIYPE